MSDWWKAAPVAEPAKDWWQEAPVADAVADPRYDDVLGGLGVTKAKKRDMGRQLSDRLLQPQIEALDTADGKKIVMPGSVNAAIATEERLQRDPEFRAAMEPIIRERIRQQGGPQIGSIEERPDRTWSELGTDTAMLARQTLETGVALPLVEAPWNIVDALNTAGSFYGLPKQTPLPKPDALVELRAQTEAAQEEERGLRSSRTLAYDNENRPQDFLGAMGYMIENPGVLATDMASTLPAMATMALPGGLQSKIATMGAQQAGATAAEVEEAVFAQALQSMPAEEARVYAREEAMKAFGLAQIVSQAMPNLIKGGSAVESAFVRGATRQPARSLGARAGSATTKTVGEATAEGGEEGIIKGIGNVYTGRPAGEGVGGAAAMGVALGGPMGAVAGAQDLRAPARTVEEQRADMLGELLAKTMNPDAVPDVAATMRADNPEALVETLRRAVAERVPDAAPDPIIEALQAAIIQPEVSDGSAPARPVLEAGRGTGVPADGPGVRPSEAAGVATEALGRTAEDSGRPPAGADDVAGAQAEGVSRDTKVVDAEGKPLVVYHSGSFNAADGDVLEVGDGGFHLGTRQAAQERNHGKQVDDFITELEITQDEDGQWFWDSGNQESSDSFDSEAAARRDAENVAREIADNSEYDAPLTQAYVDIRNPMRVTDQGTDWREAIAEAKRLGYDGIVYRNLYEDKGKDSYIAFRPDQIKLISDAPANSPTTATATDQSAAASGQAIAEAEGGLDRQGSSPQVTTLPAGSAFDQRPAPKPADPLDMKPLIGWSQEGGRMLRAPYPQEMMNEDERAGKVGEAQMPRGEVIGRTTWVGLAGPDGQPSSFWRNRPDPRHFSEAEARAAMDKYERGEPLKPKEQRFIDYARDAAAEYAEIELAMQEEMRDIEAAQTVEERQRDLEEIADALAAAEADPRIGNESYEAWAERLMLPLEPTREDDARAEESRTGEAVEAEVPARASSGSVAEAEAGGAGEVAPPPAASSEPAAESPENVTALKNEVNDAERESLGGDPIDRSGVIGNQALVDDGRRAIEANPDLPGETVGRIVAGGPVSLADAGVLIAHKVTLNARLSRAFDRMNDADAGAADRDVARTLYQNARAEMLDLMLAVSMIGTEGGRLLQIRKAMVDEQYTVVSMMMELSNAKEGALTDKETAEIEADAKLYADLSKELESARLALEAEKLRADGLQAIADLRRDAGKRGPTEARARRRSPLVERLREKHDRARAALDKVESVPSRRSQSGAVMDPRVLGYYADIGAYVVAKGFNDFASFVAEMTVELGDKFSALADTVKRSIFDAAQSVVEAEQSAPRTPAEVLEGLEVGKVEGSDIYQLALAYVREGLVDGMTRAKGMETLLDRIAADLQDTHPEIDAREAGILLTGYGKVVNPPKDAAKVTLSELREIARISESIQRLEDGLAPLKTGKQRAKKTEEIRQLLRKLNDMLKEKEQQFKQTPEGLTLYQTMRRNALLNRKESLQRQIEAGKRDVRPKSPALDAANLELELEVKELDRELSALDKVPLTPDQRYNRSTQSRLANEINRLEQRIATNDLSPKPPKPDRVLEDATLELQTKINKIRLEFHRRVHAAELANRTGWQKTWGYVGEWLGLARAVLTSGDLMPVLRQGSGMFFSGRWNTLARATSAGLQAMVSEKGHLRVNQALWSDPDIKVLRTKWKHKGRSTKLAISEPDADFGMGKVEETYASQWIGKLPTKWKGALLGAGVGFAIAGPAGVIPGAAVGASTRTVVLGSARGFEAFLSVARAEHFKVLAANLVSGTPTQEQGYAIANMVNVFTGRGDLGKMSNAANFLAAVFFAPRFAVSQFQTLLLQPLRRADEREVRKLVAQEYARRFAGTMAAYGLVALATGLANDDEEDDQASVSFDLRGTNFAKWEFGAVKVDPLGGLIQPLVFLTRQITGEKVQANGKLVPLRSAWRWNDFKDVLRTHFPATDRFLEREKYGKGALTKKGELGYKADTGFDVFLNYLRGKASPAGGAVATGLDDMTNIVGERQSPFGMATNILTPMTPRGIYEVLQTEHGYTSKGAFTALALIGAGVNVYESKEDKAAREKKEEQPGPTAAFNDPRL